MERERATLILKEHLPPECTCAVEDRVRGIEGVLDAAAIPVDDVVQVTYDPEKLHPGEIKAILERCS